MCVFGRPKTHIGGPPQRRIRTAGTWAEHTRRLPPLEAGDLVRVQNQTGPHPNKWDRTGSVAEHDKYVVKIDGSGRVSARNRKFLRKFYPVHSDRPPPRSIYDNLASRVAVPALIATPQLPGLASGQVRPVTESGPTPPPALPPAGSPRRGMQPTPIVPVVPAQGILRTPPPGFVAPMAPLPPPPDVPPATDLRRSTRRAGVPAWHKDFAMG